MEKKIIHILHVIYSFELGGTEGMLVNLINGMEQGHFKHSICCLTHNGPAVKKLKLPEVKIYECNKKEGIDLSIISKISKIVKAEGIDILHGRAWVSLIPCIMVKLLSRRKIKVIFGYHGQNFHEIESGKNNFRRLLIQNILLRHADAVYALNKAMCEYFSFQVGIKSSRFLIIPNGIDTPQRCREEDLAALKGYYKINSDQHIIGFVGRLDKVKNLPILFKAFKHIKENYPKTKLLIVGDGPEEKSLKKLADELFIIDSVVFAGWVDNPDPLYQLMDIYVQPSHFEGMSNAIVQAMAHQLPVVATDVGGNSDLVLNNKTGYLISLGDIDGLSKVISQLIVNTALRKELGLNAREYVLREYSLRKVIDTYKNLYLGLMQGKKYA